MNTYYRTNNRIFANKIKLVGIDGKIISEEMAISEALNLAREQDLDLVEIVPNIKPPVCKIMDFGKFKYEKEREERVQKAKQKKTNELKGVRISFREGEHDLNFKKKSAVKFLDSGCKVKVELTVKGREKAHFDLANEKLQGFLNKLNEEIPISVEGRIQRSPRGLNVIVQGEKK